MTGEKVSFEQTANEEQKTQNKKRVRSTIDFPYGGLDKAEEIANTIHENAGTSCTIDQLAGYMGKAARGGGFRVRVMTTKSFGLIDNPRGVVALTDLGQRIVNPS